MDEKILKLATIGAKGVSAFAAFGIVLQLTGAFDNAKLATDALNKTNSEVTAQNTNASSYSCDGIRPARTFEARDADRSVERKPRQQIFEDRQAACIAEKQGTGVTIAAGGSVMGNYAGLSIKKMTP